MKTKKIACYNCGKITKCYYKEELVKETIDNLYIEYISKNYYCSICNEEVYDEKCFDYNIRTANEELRKQVGLITTTEIYEILKKYHVSQKNLSSILGFGEIQISRYLKSGNPRREHSDVLKSVLDNPFIFEMYLLNYKDKLSKNVFKRIYGNVKQLELSMDNSKLYSVVNYISNDYDDITNLSLQKILYFVYGFSNKILGHDIFDDTPEAWVRGPVYEEIYNSFAYLSKSSIPRDKIVLSDDILTDEEKDYIDNICKYFACFSGSKLTSMTHLTDPWINARAGLKEDEASNRVISKEDIHAYFDKVIKDFNIREYKDIGAYVEYLFKESF